MIFENFVCFPFTLQIYVVCTALPLACGYGGGAREVTESQSRIAGNGSWGSPSEQKDGAKGQSWRAGGSRLFKSLQVTFTDEWGMKEKGEDQGAPLATLLPKQQHDYGS